VTSGIYLHIPFCRIKCPYCDFVSVAGREDRLPGYVASLRRELELRFERPEWRDRRPSTLYFGGGTPSLLEAGQLAGLLEQVERLGRPGAPMEVTLEANPGTVDRTKLRALREAGVNRLTIGCQTFRPDLLPRLGRIHDVADSLRALDDAAAVGFSSLNLDLMFGIPGQTLADWAEDLDTALATGADHLSLYDLTVEPGTEFARLRDAGRLELPDDEQRAAMYELAVERLGQAGLARYEVSNFARAGSECLHNRIYWQGDPWIGAGVAAHGFEPSLGAPHHGRRWWNHGSLGAWAEQVAAGRLPEHGDELLTRTQAMDERFLLGLRTRDGVDLDRFERDFGFDPAARLGATLRDAIDRGLLTLDGGALKVSEVGVIILDSLVERLCGQLDSADLSSTLG
jgi:oxygen-independent coproporphyrinogen III oxidase